MEVIYDVIEFFDMFGKVIRSWDDQMPAFKDRLNEIKDIKNKIWKD